MNIYIFINKKYIIGVLDENILNYIIRKIRINNIIKIILHYEYKIFYDIFSNNDLIFKQIFVHNKQHNITNHNCKILLSTENNNCIEIAYYTLYLLVEKNNKYSENDINDILQKDIYFMESYKKYDKYKKNILLNDLSNTMTEKNEIKYYFVHFDI